MTEQLTLFNFAPTQTIKTVHDPYWDEMVLSPNRVEGTGQLSLLYDDTEEPPDPDEYPTIAAYESAHAAWARKYPHLVPFLRGMSDDASLSPPTPSSPSVPSPQSPIPAPQHIEGVTSATFPDPVIPSVGEQVTRTTFPNLATALVGEQVTTTTPKTAPQHDTHWIEKYYVKRSGNKYWYWRYMYMEGRKIHRVYIGAVGSKLAEAKRSGVQVAIADGRFSPQYIKNMILAWRNHQS